MTISWMTRLSEIESSTRNEGRDGAVMCEVGAAEVTGEMGVLEIATEVDRSRAESPILVEPPIGS